MAPATWLVPEEIKNARERRGFSLREAAEEAGLPEQILRAWEEGADAPTLEQAHALAQLYHCSLQRFLHPSPETEPRFDLRIQRRFDQEEQELHIKEAASQFEHWCEAAAELEELTDHRPVNLRRIGVTDPDNLAKLVRKQYGLGSGPIKSFRRLLERTMGILVFSLPLEDVSGMSWWHPRVGPAILVNRNDTAGRQNWTLAHELGHLLHPNGVVICDTIHVNQGEPKERLADSFAAEFLLPSEDIRRYVLRERLEEPTLSKDETLSQVARRYGVSREAIARRLESLGFLPFGFTNDQLRRWYEDWKERQRFFRGSARRSRRVKDLGETFVGKAIKAYLDGKITLSKLSEELQLGVIEAEELVAEQRTKHGAK